MTQLDTPSEQPESIKKQIQPPKEKVISAKDRGSSEPTPVPEPPWGDHAAGSDWLE